MSEELFEQLQRELASLDKTSGLTMTGVFMLPKALTKLIGWIIRQKNVRLDELADFFQQSEDAVRPVLTTLVSKGFIMEREGDDKIIYRVKLSSQTPKRRSGRSDLWQALDEQES